MLAEFCADETVYGFHYMAVLQFLNSIVKRYGIHNLIEVCVFDSPRGVGYIIIELLERFAADIVKINRHHLIIGEHPCH